MTNRTLIGKRQCVTASGERVTILHFVRIKEVTEGTQHPGIRRVDEYETQDGLPVMCTSWGDCRTLIGQDWVELAEL
jgi:hypothetical protein